MIYKLQDYENECGTLHVIHYSDAVLSHGSGISAIQMKTMK